MNYSQRHQCPNLLSTIYSSVFLNFDNQTPAQLLILAEATVLLLSNKPGRHLTSAVGLNNRCSVQPIFLVCYQQYQGIMVSAVDTTYLVSFGWIISYLKFQMLSIVLCFVDNQSRRRSKVECLLNFCDV